MNHPFLYRDSTVFMTSTTSSHLNKFSTVTHLPSYALFSPVTLPSDSGASQSESPITYRWVSKNPDTRYTPVFMTFFTLVHFWTGASFYHLLALTVPWSLGISFFVWSVLHLFYEWKDMWTSYIEEQEGYTYEHSLFNTIGDQFFAVAGFLFAWAMRKRLSSLPTFVILFAVFTVDVLRKLE